MDVLESAGCDWIVNELGPPPDAILRIPPPPPMPGFIDWDGWIKDAAADVGSVHQDGRQVGNNGTGDAFPCHWCHLTRRLDAAPAKSAVGPASDAEMAMEDTWLFVILASSLMLLLGVLLSGLVYWTLNRKSTKSGWHLSSFFSESGSVLVGGCGSPSSHANGNEMPGKRTGAANDQAESGGGGGGGALTPAPQQAAAPSHLVPPTRALWAGVKTSEGNHYTITHAQPFEQRAARTSAAPAANRSAPDEDSAGYTTLQPTRDYPTDNQIYYCCTDLMVTSPRRAYPPRPGASFKVTSLDDSVDPAPATGSLYVNMSPVHPFRGQVSAPCSSTCCPLRSGCHGLAVNALAIGRSSVCPALHLRPIAAMSLGENWRKV